MKLTFLAVAFFQMNIQPILVQVFIASINKLVVRKQLCFILHQRTENAFVILRAGDEPHYGLRVHDKYKPIVLNEFEFKSNFRIATISQIK